MAIQNSRMLPISSATGSASSCVATTVKAMRMSDGDEGAENDAPLALVRRQAAAGERDDHGVVARQDQIDQHDLAERRPEYRRATFRPSAKSANCATTFKHSRFPCPWN